MSSWPAGAGRSPRLWTTLVPLALVLLFEAGFALAVMSLDRSLRGLPANVAYVAFVEGVTVALALGWAVLSGIRVRRQVLKAMASPLDSALPPARGYEAGLWRDLLVAARRAAKTREVERETAAKAELEAFLATVHALKTPATALSLLAERAERDGLPLGAEDLRLEIDELDRILDRAVGRLRLEDFDRGSRMSRVDAAEAVRASVRKHRRILIARRVAVDLLGGFEAATDPWWLSFILDQLVSNAAKYANSRVALRLRAEGRIGIVEVEDDGPGLDEEDALRLFSRSASGSASAAPGSAERGPSSSGYGLYLAREAASRLGARIELAARPDGRQGTLARLALPLSPSAAPKLAPM